MEKNNWNKYKAFTLDVLRMVRESNRSRIVSLDDIDMLKVKHEINMIELLQEDDGIDKE